MQQAVQFEHAGIISSSEENSDRFFVELMGLEKKVRKPLEAGLAGQLFGYEQEMLLIKYGLDDAFLEIIVHPEAKKWASPIGHACLVLKDREAFVERCLSAGLSVRQVSRGDWLFVFVADFDGNLYEIKPQQ